jgi:hypothetical protein
VVKVNVKLLRQIKKHILKNPDRLYMGEGILVGEPGDALPIWEANKEFPECGTTACIAGWACILSGSNPKRLVRSPWMTIRRKAQKLIGIEGDPDFLFQDEQWPSKFANAFERAVTAKTQAKITGERIDHFIKTGN